jgi:hypothetical protein
MRSRDSAWSPNDPYGAAIGSGTSSNEGTKRWWPSRVLIVWFGVAILIWAVTVAVVTSLRLSDAHREVHALQRQVTTLKGRVASIQGSASRAIRKSGSSQSPSVDSLPSVTSAATIAQSVGRISVLYTVETVVVPGVRAPYTWVVATLTGAVPGATYGLLGGTCNNSVYPYYWTDSKTNNMGEASLIAPNLTLAGEDSPYWVRLQQTNGTGDLGGIQSSSGSALLASFAPSAPPCRS